jgi:hypothetical protein
MDGNCVWAFVLGDKMWKETRVNVDVWGVEEFLCTEMVIVIVVVIHGFRKRSDLE